MHTIYQQILLYCTYFYAYLIYKKEGLTLLKNAIFVERVLRKDPYIMPKYHFHEEYEIYYLIQGERYYFIKDKTYHVKKGDLIFIDRNILHKTADVEKPGHERYLINLRKDFLDSFPYYISEKLFQFFSAEKCIITPALDEKIKIESIFDEMYKEYLSLGSEPPIYLQTLVIQLLYFINKIVSKNVNQPSNFYNINNIAHLRILEVVEYINIHFKEPLSLSELSQHFFFSPFYLSRLFKKVTGFSLIEYINSIRVKEAQELLKNSDKKISDIALEVGYDNITHFERVFKQITNLSPRAYKNKYIDKKGV